MIIDTINGIYYFNDKKKIESILVNKKTKGIFKKKVTYIVEIYFKNDNEFSVTNSELHLNEDQMNDLVEQIITF